MSKIIYLDNAATTPVRKEVILAMKPYWNKVFGNPSSITKFGVKAQQTVLKSREIISSHLSRRPNEIIFTSGGTESNNLAILGTIKNLEKQGQKISDLHLITTNIEHSSITECFKELERQGAKVDYLAVNQKGIIEPKELRKFLKPNTVLVSIGYANNEIGSIQPISEIAKEIRYVRKNRDYPLFHTDASQAGLYCNLNINDLGVDLLTLDAQKMYGPKGIGILFIKSGTSISPLILGGGQERGLRSGTENVPLIVGLAKALEKCRQGSVLEMSPSLISTVKKMTLLRNYFWQRIQKSIPEAVLNGDLVCRLPNNLNISIPNIDSEFTVLCLDEAGVVCSTKSACNQGTSGSFVVYALNQNDTLSKSTIRFSLGDDITKKNIDFVVKKLTEIIKKQQNFKLI